MTIYDEMLSCYHPSTLQEERNVQYEVMQQVALAGLHRGGFFDHAAFYGGTCLRIFYGMPRFSEDMDFSLLCKSRDIHIENFFGAIEEEFRLVGREVVITKKNKQQFSRVESAFLKDNTEVYDIAFDTDKSLKVKIELDTNPPLGFTTEQKLLMQPYSFYVNCFTLPSLFAGKMHALVYRKWKHRVKGRDWFDFEWYVKKNVPLDFVHLQQRIEEFNGIRPSKEDFLLQLKQRLTTTNINQVRQDVQPFIPDSKVMNIWSNEYFLQLADRIQFEKE